MGSQTGGLAPARRRELDDFLDRELTDHDVPGASLAVFDGEGVLYRAGYGARSLDPVAPATADAPLEVASVTKTFTAMAVLQFVESGDIALDDPVATHVDVLAEVPGEAVTVGSLLAHTSGIPSDLGQPGGIIADRGDLVRRVDRWAERRLTDRDRLMYLNDGYVVLAALVEALAGRPHADHLAEAVLEPMGMERSTLDQDAIEATDDGMVGYAGASRDELEPARVGPVDFPALRLGLEGPGGLRSPVTDLAALGPVVLDGGQVEGHQVLSPASVDRMTSPQGPPAPTVEGYDLHMGYGWLLEDLLGERLVYTGGGKPGYGTFVGVLPERGVGVALGFNHAAVPKIDVGMAALAVVCGERPVDTVGWYRARRAVDVASGTYEDERTGRTATVEPAAEDGLLSTKVEVTVDGGRSFRAAPTGDDPQAPTFETTLGNGFRWTVEFPATDAGRTMVLTRGHRATRFDRR